MESARLEIMDLQRFDPSKRTKRPNLAIRTGADDAHASNPPSNTAEPATRVSWITFREPSPEPSGSDSESDLLEETSTPPTSLQSSIIVEDAVLQTDVFDKGDDITTTRTIIRPIPRSPILGGCFSRPASPLNIISRPSSPINFSALNCFKTDAFEDLGGCFSRPASPSPLSITSRPSSPINFSALNCFKTDAFEQEVSYLQEKRALELEGQGALEVHVHEQVTTEVETTPWIVQQVIDPEGLRRRLLEPRTTVSSP